MKEGEGTTTRSRISVSRTGRSHKLDLRPEPCTPSPKRLTLRSATRGTRLAHRVRIRLGRGAGVDGGRGCGGRREKAHQASELVLVASSVRMCACVACVHVCARARADRQTDRKTDRDRQTDAARGTDRQEHA